jgi:conjugative relaxase-like TrwC/TraI family protein
VWKLRVGAEAYYLSQVARGLDEYYTGAGEAPGMWVGGGIDGLGLVGEVDAVDLRAVLAGLAPGTGLTPNGDTLRTHPRRVPGFDLTFAVPKSVSLAYALADRHIQHVIVTACEAALAETLGWLEREACFVRRGTNKAENRNTWGDAWGTRRMIARGFVGAAYRHRTSRAGDPHLHWHVLVANLAQGVDGRWSAIDGRAIYDTARTGGAMFQAAMRRELSAALGVEWGPMHEDAAEIAGIPERVLRAFSRRRDEIAEWLDAAGESGSAAAAAAQRSTRQAKQVPADFAAVEAAWHARADELGWGPAQLEQLLASIDPAARTTGYVIEDVTWHAGSQQVSSRSVGFDEWLDSLLETRVTAHDGTFTRLDLTRAVASMLPASTSIELVETTVQRALASPAIVAVGDHWRDRTGVQSHDRSIPDDRALRYTSRFLLAAEQRLLAQLTDGTGAGVGVLDPDRVEAAIRASTLGVDQAEAVQMLTAAGDRIGAMVGRAGTGKTHTLGVLRVVFESAGYTVIGLAPSARAARELEAGSGIRSTTIARHRVEQRAIDATTIVVVDEAGMGGTYDLAAIVDQAVRVGAKVVLVGDHRQLPEVAAGGVFSAALDTLGGRVVELTVNRRQQLEWEQAALDQLRHGDVGAAFGAYRLHGRVVLSEDPGEMHARAISDWQQLRASGDALMLAGTRAEAHLLNHHARRLLAAAGELDVDNEFEIAGRMFAPGEQVVLRRNDTDQRLANGDRFAVDNGMRATITRLDRTGLHVRLSTGEDVVLERSYVERRLVDYAYALTIHTVQGVTCDHVLVVGPAGLYREAIYVALSRARLSAWIHATVAQVDELDRHGAGIPLPTETAPDAAQDLLNRMQTSGAKSLVAVGDPDAARVAELATSIPARELLQRATDAHEAELAVDVVNPAELREAYNRIVNARSHLEPGRRVRALDRDNVGWVVAIDDHTATCLVHFDNDRGHSADKTIAWDDLVVIDNPEPVTLPPAAAATLAARARTVADAQAAWATELSTFGVEPGDADLYRRAVHVAVDRAAHQLRSSEPEWLTTWLGPRPADAPGAAVWDDATTRLAHHRLIHDVAHDVAGLGPRPDDVDAAQSWRRLMIRTLEDRCWLADRRQQPVEPQVVRSHTELSERRAELEQRMRSAPPDQHAFIERLTRSNVAADELHDRLLAATSVQDARRDWIVANWPHVVELEQVNTLLATQPQLPQSSDAQPEPVGLALDRLRHLAPTVDHREERSLAVIDREAIADDPVHRLEERRRHLRRLAAGHAANPAECDAIDDELTLIRDQLRIARRTRAVEQAFDRYLPDPTDDARATRIATVAHDALTTQPTWVVEFVRHLHDEHQLSGRDVTELATWISAAAAHLDRHGRLPDGWPALATTTIEAPQPVIEIG